ncbi:MAG: LamG-like jellyroll fold domain-containing protein, partial [Planctomycetota bacterium]
NADNPWGPLVNVQEINSRYSEAFPCLSADGLTLYFSDFYDWHAAGDRPGGVGYHDLWMCTRASRNDPWAAPVNMGAPFNSGNAEVSPTISHDGLTFIFGSKNRSGGLGHYDLWMSTRPAAEGDWAAPVNMGPAVNSSAFDAEACLSTDGLVLFFCSTLSGGVGSYDLWLTTRPSQAAAWNPPVNLGPAINTSGAERVPSLSPDQKTLYFGSAQSGGLESWECAYEVPIVPILDFNGDSRVDGKDILTMAGRWGTRDPICDIGPAPWGDGIVDVEDVKVLAEYIGKDVDDPTLIAHWALDETEGDIAYDTSGQNDGVVAGGAVWRPETGAINGALGLDGIDDLVGTPSVLNPADGPFSVLAWIRGGEPGQVILSQIDGANWLCTDPMSCCLMTDLNGTGRDSGTLYSDMIVTDGSWHRIALVCDGDDRSLYVDDILVAQDTQAGGPPWCSGGLNLGCGIDMAPDTFFSGLIDDVRIYNRAVRP